MLIFPTTHPHENHRLIYIENIVTNHKIASEELPKFRSTTFAKGTAIVVLTFSLGAATL